METVPPRIFSPENRPAPPFPKWTALAIGALVLLDVADSFAPSLIAAEMVAGIAAFLAALRLGMFLEALASHRLRRVRPPVRAAITAALMALPFALAFPLAAVLSPIALDGTAEILTFVAVGFVLAATGGLFVVVVEGVAANLTRTFRRRLAAVTLLASAMAGMLGTVAGPAIAAGAREVGRGEEGALTLPKDPTMTYVTFPLLGETATRRTVLGTDVPYGGGVTAWLLVSNRAFWIVSTIMLAVSLAIPLVTATLRIGSDSVERLEPLVAAFGALAKGDRNVRVERGGAREFERLADRFNEMVENLAEAERMERAFGIYVSGQVLDRIKAQHGEAVIPASLREASVLFADIRGFTAMSEKLSPEQVVAILNRWFDRVVNIVAAHDGYLNKFIGDAVVVVFNGPMDQQDHAVRASRCAIEFQKAAIEMNAAGVFGEIGELRVGVGVATGPMVCGNVGGSRQMEYTVIGDTVNLASRLTSKAAPGEVLVSEATGRALGEVLPSERLDPVPVKGKAEPVTPYRVFPLGASTATKRA